MPIRFRCAYCNQLMRIGHRKAGQVVVCPNLNCKKQVVVPSPEGVPAAANPPRPLGSGSPVGGGAFDVSNFGHEFIPDKAPPFSPQAEPLVWNNPIAVNVGDEFDVIPIPGNSLQPRGLVLSPLVLTLVGILGVILLGLAFVLGLLIGQSNT